MRNPISQLNFLFFTTLMAILIWMTSPHVKGKELEHQNAFPFAAYEAHYTVNWHGIYAGESIHRLSHKNDGSYHFEARTNPRLQILPFHYLESSDFSWKTGKIIPQNYYYNIQEGKRHKQGNVAFDWQNHKIKNTHSLQPWETSMPEDIQDKLTQTLSLRQALIAGKSQFQFTVAEEDKIKNYTFVILGSETLITKLGRVETVKLQHISRKGHRTTMWFAKSLNYLPVKMVQLRKGKQVAGGEIVSFTSVPDKSFSSLKISD